jgi:FkbM family methyltransferase
MRSPQQMANFIDFIWKTLIVRNADLFYQLKKTLRFKVHQTRLFGKPIKYIDSSYFPMKKEIINTGIYTFHTDKESPYILDCGANIGLSVIFFKHLYPKAEIIAFEADPTICEILIANLESQGIGGVTVMNRAVWKEETTITFFKEGGDAGRIMDAAETGKESIQVPSVVLSQFINKEVDLLKIDIEGAELDVLKEIEPRLHLVKHIFVEYHSFVDRSQQLDALLQILTKAGFRYYIQTIGIFSHQPYVRVNRLLGMDMQMNVFGYRA